MLLNPTRVESLLNLSRPAGPRLLNIGCGNHFHGDWINLDLISDNLHVIPHDVTCGLPFADGYFDSVYHSHVLEHLHPDDGVKLLNECFRVLKPGGIARIVVPDLERIAKLYLEMHDRAWRGDQQAKTDYDWMKLELLDQLVRDQSGGQMGQYMTDPEIRNSDFVRSRVGEEYRTCRAAAANNSGNNPSWRKWHKLSTATRQLREFISRKIVRMLLGRSAEFALREGLFRSSGEVHRWMYDRFSLRDICGSIGFVSFQIRSARDSQIRNFARYQLDVVNDEVRKPDSLFVEVRKAE